MPSAGELASVDELALSVLEQLARSLHVGSADLQPTLDAIAEQAIEAVEPAGYAGVILLVKGTLTPQSTIGTPPQILDQLQQKLGEGPCMTAADTQASVLIDDTGSDPRWPELMSVARDLGVASMLCVPLYAGAQRLGALSLYGKVPAGFTAEHEKVVRLFATFAALALADALRVHNLTTALNNRDLIGQAKGILIERLRITGDAAFEQLSRASQLTNRKLAVVAQHLVETGELPGSS